MASSTKQPLLNMPNKILLLIFHQMPTVQDACNFAQSCLQLYKLFISGGNKINILRSAASVPIKPNYSLDTAFSGFVRIPPLNWCLHGVSTYILIDVDYGPISEDIAACIMLDLTAIQELSQHPISTFQATLEIFLAQFYEPSYGWQNRFGHITTKTFSAAAQLQMNLLHASSASLIDLSSETTVIALSLHCFLIVYNLNLIALYAVNCTEDKLFEHGSSVVLIESGDNNGWIFPTVQLHRLEKWRTLQSPDSDFNVRKPGFHLDSGLDTMLDYITHLSFQLLNTQDPRHWPTVLHVLLIFEHIQRSLRPNQEWMQKVNDAHDSLDFVLRDLERYYYVCTDGGQILSNHWNEDDYGRRVGQDQIAIQNARILNRLWLDAGNEKWYIKEERGNMQYFLDKIDYFADGLAI